MHSATLFEFLKPGFESYLFIYLFVRNTSKDLRNVRYITHGTEKKSFANAILIILFHYCYYANRPFYVFVSRITSGHRVNVCRQ